jgi:hypothetical protein
MSYRLNKTNNDLLVELADGDIDNTSTDITLVGRNYKGFGEFINENFIRIIENFANTNPPDAPLQGQLWYDTNQQKLQVYDGSAFKPAGSPILSTSRPEMVAGDLWIDTFNRKLYFYDGNTDNELTLVGPSYDRRFGKSGFEVESVVDTFDQQRVIIKLNLADNLFAVITDTSFRLDGNNKIEGYPDDPNDTVSPARQLFQTGINLVDKNYEFRGTAQTARNLLDSDSNSVSAQNFVRKDKNSVVNRELTINNNQGLQISTENSVKGRIKPSENDLKIESIASDGNLMLSVKQGNTPQNALMISAADRYIGVYTDNPEYTLDVNGSFRSIGNAFIDGDLTVTGNATYLDVNTLTIEKVLELGIQDGTDPVNNEELDGAGIIARSTDGDKNFLYDNTNLSWTSNISINVENSENYKIGGNNVLSLTSLGPTISSAPGLTSIGNLNSLEVDLLKLDGNTIQSIAGSDIVLLPNNAVSVSNSKITGLAAPESATDATNKQYVDTELKKSIVSLTLDITGLSNPDSTNPYEDVKQILNAISPADEKIEEVEARLHTYSYTTTEITGIDIESALSKTFANVNNVQSPVDLQDNLTSISVLQDINFSPANSSFSAKPARSTMFFEVENSEWVWKSTIAIDY